MRLERRLVNSGHVRHLIVSQDTTGWELQEEEDSIVIRHAHLDDWHRVERAVRLFDYESISLERSGWIESVPDAVMT